MLYLYPSNKTQALAELMAGIMGQYPLSDPFEHEIVLTQSYGMGVWLQQKISEQLGISALVQTKMPGAFVWDLIEKLIPQIDGKKAKSRVQLYEKSALRWEIYRQLPELLRRDSFKTLRLYLNGVVTQSGSSDQRPALFELSDLLADMFDAYQNYRSDWILKWEEGHSILLSDMQRELVEDETWQKELWCSLYPELKPGPKGDKGHRASQLTSLHQLMNSESDRIREVLPKRIYLFGMGAVPSQWIPLFVAIAKHTDVHLFLQNPSQYYWGDIKSAQSELNQQVRKIQRGESSTFGEIRDVEGNALLASWGELGKAFLSELYTFDQADGLHELEHSLFEESAEHTALGVIQNDILNLRQECHKISTNDASLRFARCHSRTREVEALRDHILSLMDADPELSERDVIVMAPDIQNYSASIESVFGTSVTTAQGKESRLLFGVSDQSMRHDVPLLESVGQILALDQARVTLAEVFELLAVPKIAERAGIDEEEVAVLSRLCTKLNVRWGLDELHRDKQSSAQESGYENTWMFGFRRCFSAYLLGEMDEATCDIFDLEPFRLHGRELQEGLGKLYRFIELIRETCGLRELELTLPEWSARLHRTFQSWFGMDSLDEDVRKLANQALEQLQEQSLLTEFQDTVPFTIISRIVTSAFDNEKVSQRFLAGRINFCNLMPMRSIPFKVVCLLGMNEGEYPRLDIKQSFDLMARLPARRGDRSRRSDDRYMFLESILSAQEHLYISYQGFNLKDNSECQPSILVSELTEYCRRHLRASVHDLEKGAEPCTESGEALLQAWTSDHRLQPFHPNYYVPSEERAKRQLATSFESNWRSLYESIGSDSISDTVTSDTFIANETADAEPWSLESLAALFSNPLAFFYRKRLGVALDRMPDWLPEEEPFSLSGLDAFVVAQEINGVLLQGQDLESCRNSLRRRGILPREPKARFELEKLERDYSSYRESIAQISGLEHDDKASGIRSISFDLALPTGGEVSSINGEFWVGPLGQIELVQSKKPEKVFFGVWFKHILWNAFREDLSPEILSGNTTLICPSHRISFPEIVQEQAWNYLEELLLYAGESLQKPKLFAPLQAFQLLMKPQSSALKWFESALEDSVFAALWYRAQALRFGESEVYTVPNPDEHVFYRQVKAHMNLEEDETESARCQIKVETFR